MADKKDPIYQPKTATVEGYTLAELTEKTAAALAGKFKEYEKAGSASYDGNRKMFSQALQEKAESTEPPEGDTGE